MRFFAPNDLIMREIIFFSKNHFLSFKTVQSNGNWGIQYSVFNYFALSNHPWFVYIYGHRTYIIYYIHSMNFNHKLFFIFRESAHINWILNTEYLFCALSLGWVFHKKCKNCAKLFVLCTALWVTPLAPGVHTRPTCKPTLGRRHEWRCKRYAKQLETTFIGNLWWSAQGLYQAIGIQYSVFN